MLSLQFLVLSKEEEGQDAELVFSLDGRDATVVPATIHQDSALFASALTVGVHSFQIKSSRERKTTQYVEIVVDASGGEKGHV